MSWSNPEQRNTGQFGQEPDRPENPTQVLTGAGLVFAVCAFLTSFLPGVLALLVLEGLLFWAAIGYMMKAFLNGERWNLRHLNAWDQSLIMLALSMAVGLFVDPSAVESLSVGTGIAPQ